MSAIDLGKFSLYLPDAVSSEFSIFHDLAELFDEEFQRDAIAKLRAHLNERNVEYDRIEIDHEADRVALRSIDAKQMLNVAKEITHLSQATGGAVTIDWPRIEEQVADWKKPKAQKWRVGDVFQFKLQDETYGFGQVLAKANEVGMAPTFALLNLRSKDPNVSAHEVRSSKVVTILHLNKAKIAKGEWKVVLQGHSPKASHSVGPWGDQIKTGSPAILESVARFYWFNECDWADINSMKKLIMHKRGFLSKFRKY